MTDNSGGPATGVTWVVVADASQAEIYMREKRFSELESVQRMTEPAARMKEGDLVADSPGRSFDIRGGGRHAMEPDHSEKERIRADFAGRIAAELEAGRNAGQFQHLAIIATPDMLGALRASLSATTRRLVVLEASKDMTGMEPAAIAREIDAE